MHAFRFLPLVALAALLSAALNPAGPVRAATITVNSVLDGEACGDGDCTLREAIENAELDSENTCGDCAAGSGADTIVFSPALAGRTIQLSEVGSPVLRGASLGITSEIVIQGDARRGLTITRNPAAPEMRLFYLSPASNVTLRHLTLSGGLARGGNGGPGGLAGSGGGGAGLGGAMYVEGTLNAESCTFSGNLAQGGNSGSTIGNETQGGVGGEPFGGSAGNPDGGDGGVGGGGGGGDVVPGSSGNGGDGGVGGGGGGGGGGNDGTGGSGGFGGGNGANGITAYGASTYGSGGCGGGGAGLGGAIFIAWGHVNATNCTFSANEARGGASGPASGAAGGAGSGLGGAVFNRNGFLTLLNVTMAGNRADQGGGGAFALGDGGLSQNTIANSILADTVDGVTDFEAQTINSGSLATSGIANLMENQSGFGGGVYSSADPNLGPLANNGGPTLTHAFAGASDAMDNGNNIWAYGLTADQRGFQPRDAGGAVDIGAYEQGAVNPFPPAAGGPIMLLLD